MFDLVKSTIKAAASVVALPTAAVADAVTLGGALTDKERPYTAEACSDLMKNIKNMTSPERKTSK